jgi:hypothetical protein
VKDIRVDEDGNLRCWKCGGKNFTQKRTFRAKATAVSAGALTLGIGAGVAALGTKKKLQCQACHEYNDVGSAKPWDGPANQKLAEKRGTAAPQPAVTGSSQLQLGPGGVPKTCGVGPCQAPRLEGSSFCGKHGPQ